MTRAIIAGGGIVGLTTGRALLRAGIEVLVAERAGAGAVTSAGGVIAKDEAQVLFIVGILWAIAVAIAAFAHPVSYYLRKEQGIRQTGRQAP